MKFLIINIILIIYSLFTLRTHRETKNLCMNDEAEKNTVDLTQHNSIHTLLS